MYEQYKKTDQVWLPHIPAQWKVEKIKHLFSERVEKGYPHELLLVSSQNMGVVPKSVYGNRTVEAQKDLHLLKLVRKGDFVISLRAFQGGIEYAYYQGIISPAYTIMVNKGNIASPYFKYLAKSSVFIDLLRLCVTGIREGQNIDYTRLKNFKIPIPPRTEQDQIVRFLDWKVSAINRLIGIKRKDTVLLEEISKAVINKVITKGLHDVPLKNSCIKWIGNIPKHWDVVRCKFLFRERDERSASGSEEHLSMSQKFGLIPDDQLNERRMLSESYQGGKLCYRDDIVLNRLKAHLGVFALSQQLGVISPDYTVLMPNKNKILPSYAETILKSDLCRGELRMRVRGLVEGFWRLYTNDFYNIFLPIPPLDEQKVIMRYIHGFSNKIERYRKNIIVEIKKLEELKNRLIADTVTGKIDVRNIEIPNYEFVGEESQAEEEIDVEASENEE